MRKISRKEIEKRVKKEFKVARRWCDQGLYRYYKMMIDTDDAEIWSDVFLSENDWKEYHKDSIVSLDSEFGYVREMEISYTEDAIQKLKESGWEITD